MKALVTGAAGVIGSHPCERLIAADYDAVGVDAFADAATQILLEAYKGRPSSAWSTPRARRCMEITSRCRCGKMPGLGFPRFFLAAMRDRPATVFGTGRQTSDFTFVADAVPGTVADVHGRPAAVYNIGGGYRVELLEAFEHIQHPAHHWPADAARARGWRRRVTCATPMPTRRARAVSGASRRRSGLNRAARAV